MARAGAACGRRTGVRWPRNDAARRGWRRAVEARAARCEVVAMAGDIRVITGRGPQVSACASRAASVCGPETFVFRVRRGFVLRSLCRPAFVGRAATWGRARRAHRRCITCGDGSCRVGHAVAGEACVLNSCKIKHLQRKRGATHYRGQAPAGRGKQPPCCPHGDPGRGRSMKVRGPAPRQLPAARSSRACPRRTSTASSASGEVRVNKGRAAADTRLAARRRRCACRRCASPSRDERRPPRRRASSRSLFEDEHLIAIDKPAGVAVHGGSGVELRRDRAAAPGAAARRKLPRAGAPARPRNLRPAAGRQEALRADGAAGPVPRAARPARPTLALVAGAWPASKKVIDVPLHKYLDAAGERRVQRASPRTMPDGMRSITPGAAWRAPTPPSALLDVTSRPAARTRSACTRVAGASDRGRRQVRRLRAQQGARSKARASSACSCTPGGCVQPSRDRRARRARGAAAARNCADCSCSADMPPARRALAAST